MGELVIVVVIAALGLAVGEMISRWAGHRPPKHPGNGLPICEACKEFAVYVTDLNKETDLCEGCWLVCRGIRGRGIDFEFYRSSR